jgi:hypothetical protein
MKCTLGRRHFLTQMFGTCQRVNADAEWPLIADEGVPRSPTILSLRRQRS